MKTGFYPGCSMKGSAREYSESLLAVAAALGKDLPEIPDWNCCGATAAHNLDRDLALALPARILAAAEHAGMDDVLVPCAACYSRLSVTRHELLQDEGLRRKISGLIESEYRGTARVVNIIEWLTGIAGLENIVKTPFAHRVACYYGCLLVRPAGVVNFDRP
ncbi:MAG TPA: heterodisulfide reductase-related iron-sulfur binding cluster, partial [Candidatus Binatia bacterium]|nr:heterodisulfide reductase-related iron-sulfur binding cluster [Candidatus Binatia bacterium]